MRYQMKFLTACVLVFGTVYVASAQDKKLTAEQELKVQVQSLKEQLHQVEIASARCDAQLADANARLASAFLTQQADELTKQHANLDEELIKTLGGDAKAGDVIDRTTTPPSLKKADPKKPKGDR